MRRVMVFALVLVFGFLAYGTVSNAAIINPSFEDPDIANWSSQTGSFTGWTATGPGAGVQDPGPQPPSVTDGEQHAFTNGPSAGGPATLSQILTEMIVDGGVYTLTVDVGQFSSYTGSMGSIRLFGSTGGISTPLSNSNGMAELTGIAPTSGTYTTDQTVTYTALASGDPFAGQYLGIELVGSVGIQVLYDNVRLAITLPEFYVPEPATLAIFGLGLAGLGYMRRRQTA